MIKCKDDLKGMWVKTDSPYFNDFYNILKIFRILDETSIQFMDERKFRNVHVLKNFDICGWEGEKDKEFKLGNEREEFIDKAFEISGLSTPSVAIKQLGNLYDAGCRFIGDCNA